MKRAALRRRIFALGALVAVTAAIIALVTLPLTVRRLSGHRAEIKRLRAWWRGAEFITDRGLILQAHHYDCGAAALKTILATRGIDRPLHELEFALDTTSRGTSLLNLRRTAARAGVPGRSWRLNGDTLSQVPLPAIALINHDHFVVIRRFARTGVLEVDDPAFGRLHWPVKSFAKAWSGETLVFDPDWKPQPFARSSFAAATRTTLKGGRYANEEDSMVGRGFGGGGDHDGECKSGRAGGSAARLERRSARSGRVVV